MKKIIILTLMVGFLTILSVVLSEEIYISNEKCHYSGWNKTYGGNDHDAVEDTKQTGDGGYIAAGWSFSYGNGNRDLWLIKVDENGNEEWNKTYGGREDDFGMAIIQTKGGCIIVGTTYSFGLEDGKSDIWLIETDEYGNEIWNKIYGGKKSEWGHNIIQTTDKSYVIVGNTGSYGSGGWDVWLIKVDENGNEEWNKTYGGKEMEIGECVRQTSDGGYIIAGVSNSYSVGEWLDAFIIKVDKYGNEEWSKTYGGNDEDDAVSIIETNDGGYIIVGTTSSYDVGYCDAWLIKIDNQGNELYNKTFGTRDREVARCGIVTTDGSYVIAGEIYLDTRDMDAWLIKCTDCHPPKIKIMRPRQGYLYLFDREIMPAKRTLILGSITVIAEINESAEKVNRVEFYLSGFEFYEYEPEIILYFPPYEWKWNERSVGIKWPYVITAGAYYGNAGGVAVDEIKVNILNLNLSSAASISR